MKLIFLFVFLLKKIFSYLKIKYIKNNPIEASSKYLIYNDLIFNLDIGTPRQKIKSIIKMNLRGLFIPNIIINGQYNENISNSFFEEYNNANIDFEGKKYEFKGGKEKIIFDNNKYEYNNFSFYLINNKIQNPNLEFGLIGLMFPSYEDNFNFLYQINQKKIISYNYKKENEGEFYIGSYPHEINKNLDFNSLKFNKGQFSLKDWMMEFTYISYGNKTDFEKRVIFPNNLKGIISSNRYQEYVNQTFFNKLFNLKKCYSEKINNTQDLYSEIIIYYCDKDIDIKKFESINFYSKDNNFTFTLDYNDLFKIYNDKYVFLAFFYSSYGVWKLGEVFQKKYNMFLDMDTKLFGFYTKSNNIKNYTFYFIFIIFILVGVILFLSNLLYHSIIKKKRKLRANELEDNYEYLVKVEQI